MRDFKILPGTKIFLFATPRNVARKLFDCGARSKKFTRRNEKIPAPPSSEDTDRNYRIFGTYWQGYDGSNSPLHKEKGCAETLRSGTPLGVCSLGQGL